MTDEQHAALLAKLRELKPVRNIRGIMAYMEVYHPPLVPFFNKVLEDVGHGDDSAMKLMLMVTLGFAAGRAYQEANPDALRDPNGYK